jgi:hypothetical protein
MEELGYTFFQELFNYLYVCTYPDRSAPPPPSIGVFTQAMWGWQFSILLSDVISIPTRLEIFY